MGWGKVRERLDIGHTMGRVAFGARFGNLIAVVWHSAKYPPTYVSSSAPSAMTVAVMSPFGFRRSSLIPALYQRSRPEGGIDAAFAAHGKDHSSGSGSTARMTENGRISVSAQALKTASTARNGTPSGPKGLN